jgi:hypothetical protein
MTEITPPSAPGSGLAERPTSSARLSIDVRPSGAKAEGTVPADQARTLIITFGMVFIGAAGIAGAVLMLQVGSGRGLSAGWLALADLALALAVAVLIAVHGHAARRRDQASGWHDGSSGK